jgi:hypothetical protein
MSSDFSREVFKAWLAGLNGLPVVDAASRAPAPPEKRDVSAAVPRSRLVAEPCAQGVRLKRYEQVAGTEEMVLVSIEVVRS